MSGPTQPPNEPESEKKDPEKSEKPENKKWGGNKTSTPIKPSGRIRELIAEWLPVAVLAAFVLIVVAVLRSNRPVDEADNFSSGVRVVLMGTPTPTPEPEYEEILEKQLIDAVNYQRQTAPFELTTLEVDRDLTEHARELSLANDDVGELNDEYIYACSQNCTIINSRLSYLRYGTIFIRNFEDREETVEFTLDLIEQRSEYAEVIYECHFEKIGVGIIKTRYRQYNYALIFAGNREC